MIFQKGNNYELEIPLTLDNDELDINNVELVEFMFNDIRKIYGEYEENKTGDVTYDTTKKCFIVPLTQQETFSLNNMIEYQARVKFTDDKVMATDIYRGYIKESISKEVL